jgi:phage terminase small subunit
MSRSTIVGQITPDDCRRGKRNRDQTPVGAPEKPDHITGRAAAVWARVVGDLVKHDLCSTIEQDVISAYCDRTYFRILRKFDLASRAYCDTCTKCASTHTQRAIGVP